MLKEDLNIKWKIALINKKFSENLDQKIKEKLVWICKNNLRKILLYIIKLLVNKKVS